MLGDLFGGSEATTETIPLTSAAQQQVAEQVAKGYASTLGLGARRTNAASQLSSPIAGIRQTAIGNMMADMPLAREAYAKAAAGKPTFEFNPQDFAGRVTTPLMSAFRDYVAPFVGEGVATEGKTPGSFYSANVGKGVAAAGSQYMTQNVLPLMNAELQRDFEAKESARAGSLQGATGLSQLPLQTMAGLTDIQNAELQSIIANLQAAGQFSTTPTAENIVTQEDSGIDLMGGALGYAAGFAISPWLGVPMAAAGAGII